MGDWRGGMEVIDAGHKMIGKRVKRAVDHPRGRMAPFA